MRKAILAALAIGLAPAAHGGDEPAEVFTFELETSWFGPVRVAVAADGTCEATFRDGQIASDVKLTAEDIETFKRLVTRPQPPAVDGDLRYLPFFRKDHRVRGSLRVLLDGVNHERRVFLFEGGDLADWLTRLMSEAAVLRALRTEQWEHFYDSLYGDVLHPSAYREALERAILTWERPDGLPGMLANLAPADEWAEVLRKGLRSGSADHMDALADALAGVGELPEGHRDARLKLLLETLEREYAECGLDHPRYPREVVRALCRERCRPAIPLVVRMIERTKTHWYSSELAEFGSEALDPLAKLLESENPCVRAIAVRTVHALADRVGRDRLAAEEEREIVRRLHVEFTLKIRKIARHDPDGSAVTAAGHALVAIAWAVFPE